MIKKLNTKNKIKTFLIIMNLLLLSFLSYATVSSENINKDSNIIITYNFDNPQIEKIIIGEVLENPMNHVYRLKAHIFYYQKIV